MNNLTQREKVLAYIVIGTLPVVALFFGFNWFLGQLKKKSIELNSVRRQLADIDLRAEEAAQKADIKNQLRQRSLDAQINVAQGEYREWLRSLVEDDLKFTGTPKVTARGNVDFKSDYGQKKNVIYRQLSYQLECQGSYKQVLELLYRFYEKNYIHRIQRLDLNLVAGKRVEGKVTYDRNRFSIKAQIQVLSLVDADDIRSPIGVENTKTFYRDLDQDRWVYELPDYQSIVLRRNLFGFPNNGPEFGSRKKEFDFEEGDRISIRLTADDEDDDDLEFELTNTDGKVPSDKIEQSRTGSFQIDIDQVGSYEFKARVVDKNYYPKSDEMLVVVNVEKKKEEKKTTPPPPKPKFDPLKFTMLEAIVQNYEGQPVCWINVRPFGQMHKVKQGDEFNVGESTVRVVQINRRNAIISVDGKHYLFGVNDSLGKPAGKLLAQDEASDTEEPPTVSGDKGNGDDKHQPRTIDVNTPSGKSETDGNADKNQNEDGDDEVAKPESSPDPPSDQSENPESNKTVSPKDITSTADELNTPAEQR